MTTVDIEQVILAILTGAGFGFLAYLVGSSWQRLALFLVLLWTMQTGPQYLWRWLDGQDVTQEVINVTVLRFTFAVAAVACLAALNRWRYRRAPRP